MRSGSVVQAKVIEEIKTHFMFKFFRKPCPLYDIMEKCGIAKQATDQNIILRMRFACWVTKATNTLRTGLTVTLCVSNVYCNKEEFCIDLSPLIY
jgi:hypothetical protein